MKLPVDFRILVDGKGHYFLYVVYDEVDVSDNRVINMGDKGGLERLLVCGLAEWLDCDLDEAGFELEGIMNPVSKQGHKHVSEERYDGMVCTIKGMEDMVCGLNRDIMLKDKLIGELGVELDKKEDALLMRKNQCKHEEIRRKEENDILLAEIKRLQDENSTYRDSLRVLEVIKREISGIHQEVSQLKEAGRG